jgi:hypothetical protein
MNFNQQLVLNQYIFSLFGVKDLEELSKYIKDDTENENVDEEGVSKFNTLLSAHLKKDAKITEEELLQYDENIVLHTKKFKKNIKWKYFQYLTLLFVEIYLDKYFSDKKVFCENLNNFLEEYNQKIKQENNKKLKEDWDIEIEKFEEENLNKIAFWNATGSGKTLLMHLNIMQFEKYNTQKINQKILITPNAGLSRQHLKEFEENGIEAQIFTDSNNNTLFADNLVEILEITKIKEEKGENTFAVESFGEDNLVLIDEGHRGSGGNEWKKNRDILSQKGFCFEYSATFGQSIGASTKDMKNELTQEYSKAILFDYSYKFFKNDGFGKDYSILNIKENFDEKMEFGYLVGSLLSFYQQKKIFVENPEKMKEYNIENPLMIFVGGSVNAVKKENGVEVSDIAKILQFFDRFIQNKNNESVEVIEKIVNSSTGIVSENGSDIFDGKFTYLSENEENKENKNDLYKNLLQVIFHGQSGNLHIDEISKENGEIGLRVGENKYFGVINIGDIANFLKLCDNLGFNTFKSSFNDNLFEKINEKNSDINILIGSKKFTEGWSSWRVTTMGLLNMGKSEGSQIIQLFGRGVRLKGKDMSLKRSDFYGENLGNDLKFVERLNVFGLKANYMEQFKIYLETEDVPTEELFRITLPVLKDEKWKNKKLKVLQLQKGKNYKKTEKLEFTLEKTNQVIIKKVFINLYTKAQSIGIKINNDFVSSANEYIFKREDLQYLNFDEIFFELLQYKRQKKYTNISVDKNILNNFANSQEWYRIEAPKSYFSISNFKDFEKIQSVFTSLLKKYLDSFYQYNKNFWEKDFMEYTEISEKDDNFIDEYNVSIEQKEENNDLIAKIKNLKEDLEKGNFNSGLELGYFKSFYSQSHLYNPLLFKDGKQKNIKITPIELNEGEMKFVQDLEKYLEKNKSEELFKNTEIFLLRNKSKTGVGFFEEGGFYPDFILWILKGDKQYITFIDPKGILLLNPKEDVKINFYEKIKEKEKKLQDKNVILNSFIISNTKFSGYKNKWDKNNENFKDELENKNVLFQEYPTYIKKMFKLIIQF